MAVGPELERRKRASRATPAKNGTRSNGAKRAKDDRGITHAELEELLHALEAARDGNFSLRLPAAGTGIARELRNAFNELADRRVASTGDSPTSSCCSAPCSR